MSRPRLLQTFSALLLACPLLLASAASAWQLDRLDGDPLGQEAFEDGLILVVVWAPWSPRCADVRSRIQSLRDRWESEAELISVVFQEPEGLEEILEQEKLDAPVFIDRKGEFARAHSVSSLPGLLVFESGKLIYRGGLAADPGPVIERALEQG